MADTSGEFTANPGRYAYARAEHGGQGRPPEQAVELHLRSETGVAHGEIPQDALDAVEGFWLRLARPADFSMLGRLGGLKWLVVQAPVPIDVGGLVAALAPTPVRSLHLEAPVSDVAPIGALTGLTSLLLSDTLVTDLSPLRALSALDDLVVANGPLSDLTPLRGMGLGRLYVRRTQVADLTPLRGMPTLQVLGLSGCPVEDLSVVTELPALHHVGLAGTAVTDLGDLPERAPGVTFEGIADSGAEAADSEAAPDAAAQSGAADLIAAFRAGDFGAKWSMLARLIATRDHEAVQEALRHQTQAAVSVRGLLLQHGRGDLPFAANPWNIRADAGLTDALDHVWRPLADRAPGFVATMHARTLGLALLADDETGDFSLAYLTWGRDADRGGSSVLPWHQAGPPVPLDDFAGPRDDAYIQVVVGSAPVAADPTAELPLLAGPVPRPVRDFWSVHHGLDNTSGGDIGGELGGTVLGFVDGDWDTGIERTGGLPPDRFVLAVGHGDFEMDALDLDVLDASGSPTVACWHWKSWTTGEHLEFWDWFDTTAVKRVWF
ncbi:hypothetical protein [Yinghuangia sp. YIM S09857]|uniref:hypothetical protein n=1 Tax=Yinghuangia sp. YIM S09857 TaxID=3436929 RepID=UPI003F52FFE0